MSKIGQELSADSLHNAARLNRWELGMKRRQARVARVVDYVARNLETRLSLEKLGRVARLSKFHFHREFAASMGIGVSRFVQLLRLKRASFRLAFDERVSITELAFDAGFANAESFSRAFRNAFGQSPRAFRRAPAWRAWRGQYRFLKRIEKPMNKVEIVHFEATKVAAIEHRGSPADEYDTARKFIEWRRANGVSPATSRTFGIHYNDSRTAPPGEYRLDICASFDGDVKPNPQGVVSKAIPACRCARIRHIGPREHIGSAEYLYNEWLPVSGESPGEFPLFFHYVNVGPDVQDHEMITDVYLPLK